VREREGERGSKKERLCERGGEEKRKRKIERER